MIRLICFVAVIAGLVGGLARAAEPQYGKYVCITDRAVGMKTPEGGGQRYFGPIKVLPDHEKFFLTRYKIEILTLSNRPIGNRIAHIPDCFSRMGNLEIQWEGNLNNYISSLLTIGLQCLSHTAVELNTGDAKLQYYSLHPLELIFQDDFANRFWLEQNGQFN